MSAEEKQVTTEMAGGNQLGAREGHHGNGGGGDRS